jgi:hypothetical protein
VSNLPQLPAGDASFVSIRENNCLYVDKTRYITQMIQKGSYYFLARPRRFGKSLTVSTFHALFSGRRDLFVGLDIENYLDDAMFRPGPVIHLDMSGALIDDGIDGMNIRIKSLLEENASDNNVELRGEYVDIIFRNLISDFHKKYGKVIILVDEYDFPLIEAIRMNIDIEKIKNSLRGLFLQIKLKMESIRFVFLTGISRFSKMGIFSALNNLTDISLQKDYGTMLGYTHDEILTNFESYIKESTKILETNASELINSIKDYYDGFCFDGENCVYNPYSTLLFFQQNMFGRFWFASGTPSIVAEHIKRNKVTIEQFKDMKITKSFALEPGELNESSTTSYLYQSGYLTLRKGDEEDTYRLDYPNQEVYESMSSLLSWNIMGGQENGDAALAELGDALRKANAKNVISELDKLLWRIPYDDFTQTESNNLMKQYPDLPLRECIYRSSLLSFLIGTGLRVDPEVHTRRGRADMVVTCTKHVWVIEIKVAETTGDVDRQADAALRQIHERGYAEGYENPILLGIAVDDSKRAIGGYRVETLQTQGEPSS